MSVTTKQQREFARAISRSFLLAYNTTDPEKIDDVVTDDFVAHHTGVDGDIEGPEAYKARIEEITTAFPDFEMNELVQVIDGEYAAGLYHWTGTHEGEFMGIPPTGKTVDTRSLTLTRMEAQKATEMWVYTDTPAMMAQLGIEPGR
jgi:steroid delta-isomerase-like uncharacterized protein